VVLRKGDYRLLFLKREENRYVLVDDWFGQLSISRELGATPFGDADPLHRLEVDLKAGLNDHDQERGLDSIRILGNMRHLQSKEELVSLLESQDSLVRTYVFEAMLRLRDYSGRLPSPLARQGILQAVRAINSPQSAPSLLEMLDDSYADNAFIAMQALIELDGGRPIDWVPPLPAFRENPNYYAARCREWWQTEHQPLQ